jgi:hypothetical protein
MQKSFKTLQHKSVLFYFLVLLVFFFTPACQNTSRRPGLEERNYSTAQQYLFKLLDGYKSEYDLQQSSEQQSDIQEKYLRELEHFLVDSLGRTIDSITVTVDTVIQDGRMITTKFHTREIEFRYGMVFKDNMNSKNDSLYQFMKELKPNQEITVNFIHLGSGIINKPNDRNVRTFIIFAYPYPLNF